MGFKDEDPWEDFGFEAVEVKRLGATVNGLMRYKLDDRLNIQTKEQRWKREH